MTRMEEPGAKIMVVDDEPQILRVLRRALESHGFEVSTAPDAATALDMMKVIPVQLLITDLRMPDMSGIELCRNVRRNSKIPILVLSVKGDEAVKIEALDAGADDYVTKPFGIGELLARVRALWRRSTLAGSNSDAVLEIGDFKVEPQIRRVSVLGREVHLTPKEYDLLLFLLRNHSRVLTHRAILEVIWGKESIAQSEYLRVFVAQLRKKIEPNPRTPRYVITEAWVGYRFNPGI